MISKEIPISVKKLVTEGYDNADIKSEKQVVDSEERKPINRCFNL